MKRERELCSYGGSFSCVHPVNLSLSVEGDKGPNVYQHLHWALDSNLAFRVPGVQTWLFALPEGTINACLKKKKNHSGVGDLAQW